MDQETKQLSRVSGVQAKPANIGVFVGLDKNEWNSIPKERSGFECH